MPQGGLEKNRPNKTRAVSIWQRRDYSPKNVKLATFKFCEMQAFLIDRLYNIEKYNFRQQNQLAKKYIATIKSIIYRKSCNQPTRQVAKDYSWVTI